MAFFCQFLNALLIGETNIVKIGPPADLTFGNNDTDTSCDKNPSLVDSLYLFSNFLMIMKFELYVWRQEHDHVFKRLTKIINAFLSKIVLAQQAQQYT